MAQKKRTKKGKGSGKQVSGNPAKRARQVNASQERSASGLRLPVPSSRTWWSASHERVLAAAAERTSVPSTPRELETWAVEILGAEWNDAVHEIGTGLHASGWLEQLLERSEQSEALGTWLLRHGLAIGGIIDEDQAADTAADAPPLEPEQRWLPTPIELEITGRPMLLRDVYGSRSALCVPFRYRGRGIDPDPHWYCWDVDECALSSAVGAGAFDDLDSAVAEWRTAVGEDVLTPGEPKACSSSEVRRLLAKALDPDSGVEPAVGNEPREFLLETFRNHARSRALARHVDAPEADNADPSASELMPESVLDAFSAWYESRHGAKPDSEDVWSLIEFWAPPGADEQLFLCCSPHRVRNATILIHDLVTPEYVPGILVLLPDWVDWCLQRAGVDGEPAERTRAMARRAMVAEKPANANWDGWEDDRFRRPE